MKEFALITFKLPRPQLIKAAAIVVSCAVIVGAAPASQAMNERGVGDLNDGLEKTDPPTLTRSDAYTNLYDGPTGDTDRAEIFSVPINYRDGNSWLEIDPSLEAVNDETVALANSANSFDLEIPRDVARDPIVMRSGASFVSFSQHGLEGTPDQTSADSVDIATDSQAVDVILDSTNTGVKESVIFERLPRQSEISYDLTTSSNLFPEIQQDRSIRFIDSAGDEQFIMPAPFMFDSSGDQRLSSEVEVELTPHPDLGRQTTWLMTIKPSATWLRDPSTRYPVTVDPTLNQSPSRSCWIGSAVRDQSNCSSADTRVRVGANTNGAQRGLLYFPVNAIPDNAPITSADLSLWLDANRSTGTAGAFYDAFIPSTMFSDNATWDSPDKNSARSWDGGGPLGGSYVTDAALDSLWLDGTTSGRVSWNVFDALQRWKNQDEVNKGLLLKQRSQNVNNTLFFGNAGSEPDRAPRLDVTWDEDEDDFLLGAGGEGGEGEEQYAWEEQDPQAEQAPKQSRFRGVAEYPHLKRDRTPNYVKGHTCWEAIDDDFKNHKATLTSFMDFWNPSTKKWVEVQRSKEKDIVQGCHKGKKTKGTVTEQCSSSWMGDWRVRVDVDIQRAHDTDQQQVSIRKPLACRP